LSDGLDDIPALLFGSRDEGTNGRKVGCSVLATEAAGDFLLDLHHAGVAFGLIVGEGNSQIIEEAQDVLFAICEAQEKIVPGSARFAATALGFSLGGGGRERRLSLVEGQPLGQDGVVTAFKLCMQARPERVESNPALAGEVCGVTGAAQQLLHLARVTSGLNFTQNHRFEFAVAAAAGAVD